MYGPQQKTPNGKPHATKGERRMLLDARMCHKPAEVEEFRAMWRAQDVTVQTYRRTVKAGGFALPVTVCLALLRKG